ncbi:BF3164 family lipoprotein [Sphingobacterium gobiense]|nr:BF3164 family lipoprotein [Sphingobacterium gobiense]
MKQLFWGFLVFLLISCRGNDLETGVYTNIQANDSLTFFVGLPVDMELYKDYLFVYDFFGENGLISVVDSFRDSTLFSFLNTGGGPDEVVSLSNLDIFSDQGRNLFGIFDVNTKRYRSYATDSIFTNQANLNPVLDRNVNVSYSINELYKTNRGYVATGFFPDGKFAIMNDSLELIYYGAEYRPQENKNFSKVLHAQANIGKSQLSPDRKWLANVIFHAGVVEFYNLETDTIVKKWEFVKDELDYTVKNGRNIHNKGVEGFISVDVTEQNVFALYAGEVSDPDAIATYGKYVYQFDFDGNLIHIYELDRKVLDIRIEGNNLKAIAHNPEPIVVSYEL